MKKLRLVIVTNDLHEIHYEIQQRIFWFFWVKYTPYWLFSNEYSWDSYAKASHILKVAREREAAKVIDDIRWKKKNKRHVTPIKEMET